MWQETRDKQVQDAYQAKQYIQSITTYIHALTLLPDVERANMEYHLACSQALAGDSVSSLITLQQAIEDGYMDRKTAETDSELASLHAYPAWSKLLERMSALNSSENTRWGDAAFATPYAENISDADKLAGLSELWSQAKYGFGNFWHVPNLNWDQTYRDYIPKVLATHSTEEYYQVLTRFYALLQDGHTGVFSPKEIMAKIARFPLRTRLIDNHLFVISSRDSDADLQGVRPGDEIVSINGEPALRWAEQNIAPYVSASSAQDRSVRIYDYELLYAPIGSQLTLVIQTPLGTQGKHVFTVTKVSAYHQPDFELMMLPGNIAYVALNSFDEDSVVKEWEGHWPEIAKAQGLILDLRENGGGTSRFGYKILSTLIEKPTSTGQQDWLTRWIASYSAWNEAENPVLLPPELIIPDPQRHFAGPVVWLISPRTFSAAEDTTIAFATSHRGKIIGETTGGSSGESFFFKLPGGGIARICPLHKRFSDGREFTGVGVQPDISVHNTRKDIVAGHDSVLVAAIRLFRAKE